VLFIDTGSVITIWRDLASSLSLEATIAISVLASGLVFTAWKIAWARGHSEGRSYEVLHGRVPTLLSRLDELRHENGKLDNTLNLRDVQIVELERRLEDASWRLRELGLQITAQKQAANSGLEETQKAEENTVRDNAEVIQLQHTTDPELEELLQIREQTRDDNVRIWELRKSVPSFDIKTHLLESTCKIVTIGNLKGGVGKTTLTANLAAFFDKKTQKARSGYRFRLSRLAIINDVTLSEQEY